MSVPLLPPDLEDAEGIAMREQMRRLIDASTTALEVMDAIRYGDRIGAATLKTTRDQLEGSIIEAQSELESWKQALSDRKQL